MMRKGIFIMPNRLLYWASITSDQVWASTDYVKIAW